MSSLFQRLQRYQRTPGRNAVEDRLTEALAVTFDAAPEAARHVVAACFDDEDPPKGINADVSTQVRRRGLRVDLELEFRSPTRLELLVCFEAKVDSRAYREQGEKYMRELEQRASCGWRFAWLTRDPYVECGRPPVAKHFTWQGLGVSLREWLCKQSDPRELHGPRLVSEFLDHLEKEQGLAFTQRLEQHDADVLGTYEVARGRLDELLLRTRDRLKDERGLLDRDDAESWPQRLTRGLPDFYLLLPPGGGSSELAWPKDSYFEWHGRWDDARERRDGSWIIGAGVTFSTDAPNEADYKEWFEAIRAGGFEYGWGGPSNEYWYVFRYLTLRELAELCDGRDVEAQAKQLACCVIKALDALNEIGPPRRDVSESTRRAETDTR